MRDSDDLTDRADKYFAERFALLDSAYQANGREGVKGYGFNDVGVLMMFKTNQLDELRNASKSPGGLDEAGQQKKERLQIELKDLREELLSRPHARRHMNEKER